MNLLIASAFWLDILSRPLAQGEPQAKHSSPAELKREKLECTVAKTAEICGTEYQRRGRYAEKKPQEAAWVFCWIQNCTCI